MHMEIPEEHGVYKTGSYNMMLEELIRKKNPNVIADIGSGSADYIINSAKENLEKTYVAIDLDYRPGVDLKKEDNVHHIRADARHLPLRDECSDVTTEFGCSPMTILVFKDGYKMFEEMRRITKPKGAGITGAFDGRMGLLPSNPKERKSLKYLADRAMEIGSESDENGPHMILPPCEEVLRIREDIKKILDVPTKKILNIFGLKTTGRLSLDPNMAEPVYYYTWKRGKPKKMNGERVLRTDFGNFGNLFTELQKIDD